MKARHPLYLGNEPVDTPRTLDVVDKYTGEVATTVALADRALVERAITIAYEARDRVRRVAPDARRDALLHCAERFRARKDELAMALCVEAGKPIRDSRGEVQRLVDTFQLAAEEATRIDGQTLNLEIAPRARGYRGFTKRVPIGAASFITPFNFPLNLVAHKVAPAIACGVPFVLKPSERTPLGATIIGEVLAETDLPAGSFSILTCSIEDLAPLVEDDRLALLSFTGSSIGWDLKRRAGRKRVVLELGGNAACIVDADQGPRLDHVVERLVFGGFYQSGQSCISVQRIVAHDAIYDALEEKLVTAVGKLVAGDPKDERTFLGPLIDEKAAQKLESWIGACGGTVLCGGHREGAMLEGTVVADASHDSDLYREEAFGPVVLLERVGGFDEAIARVNDSRFGLQAGLFTDSLEHAMRAWDDLEVGGVIVGDIPSFRVDNMPYGGVKGSGFGREGIRSSIVEMTEERLLVVKA